MSSTQTFSPIVPARTIWSYRAKLRRYKLGECVRRSRQRLWRNWDCGLIFEDSVPSMRKTGRAINYSMRDGFSIPKS